MAPSSKKSAPRTPVARRPVAKKPRLSQAEATVKMLHVTSTLLLELPPEKVTVQRICQAAGVHTDYVVRYFGSREELMIQAIEAAFLGVVLRNDGDGDSRIDDTLSNSAGLLEKAHARFRTIAYLLGCGVDPERFKSSQKIVIAHLLAESKNANTSERTKINLILIGTLLFQGMAIFGEVNDLSDQQKIDILSYIGYLPRTSESVQRDLGWDKSSPKKRK